MLEDGSECGDALDLGTELDQTPIDMTALIDHLWHAEQRAAGAPGEPAMAQAAQQQRTSARS